MRGKPNGGREKSGRKGEREMLDGVKHSHSFNMKLSLWVKTVLLLAFVVIFLIPFFYMFGSAFKTNAEISSYPPSILPGEIYTGNFNTLNETAPFSTFFKNSLKMAAVSAVGVVVTSTLAGFIFSKYKFRANKLLFGLIFATSMIPFEMYMVPLYINMVDLGFGNTFVGIVSPYIIMSFGIFFMRQICSQQIPDDLLDAARIDGCSEIQIFIKIVFPLLKSAIAALAILAFVEGWRSSCGLAVFGCPDSDSIPGVSASDHGEHSHDWTERINNRRESMKFSKEKTPFGSVRQLGLLTGSLERFIENMRRTYGLEPDRTAVYPVGSSAEECVRKLAYYNFPEIELEIVEPVNATQEWHDFIAKRGDCLHHIQYNVDDLDSVMKTMEKNGVRLIERGHSISDPRVEFLFFDTIDSLGYVTEIVNFREFE